jgi:PemK-like, MazF-like toxin of type II toxin-antitoxin system
MGKPVIGEVVVLPFPQTNLQTGKRRPALVVADLAGDDLILCQITSHARSDGYSVPLRLVDFERGSGCGQFHPPEPFCSRLITL